MKLILLILTSYISCVLTQTEIDRAPPCATCGSLTFVKLTKCTQSNGKTVKIWPLWVPYKNCKNEPSCLISCPSPLVRRCIPYVFKTHLAWTFVFNNPKEVYCVIPTECLCRCETLVAVSATGDIEVQESVSAVKSA